jgi:hypothetical protein
VRLLTRHRRTRHTEKEVSVHSVLVIDGLVETEQVLKAVLEPRGLRINRIRCLDPDRSAVEHPLPSVVVMHSDGSAPESADLPTWRGVPHVFIHSNQAGVAADAARRDCVLQQPFHYPELIDTIERILTEHSDTNEQSAE